VTTDNGPGPANNRAWSVSQTEQFNRCRLSWHLRHVLAMPPAHYDSPHRIMGSALHAGLAAAYENVPRHPGGRHTLWRDTGSLALAALNQYLEEHGRDLRRAHHDDARRLLQDVLSGIPTPDKDLVLGVEHGFSFVHKGQKIDGRIDLVTRTGINGIHIRDWKLGDVPRRAEELEGNVQLAIYTAVAKQLWPWADIVSVGLYSITRRREISAVLAPESVAYHLDCLKWDADAAHNMRLGLGVVVAEQGPHCGTCDFRAYCPVTRAAPYPVLPGVDVPAGIATVDRLLNP